MAVTEAMDLISDFGLSRNSVRSMTLGSAETEAAELVVAAEGGAGGALGTERSIGPVSIGSAGGGVFEVAFLGGAGVAVLPNDT